MSTSPASLRAWGSALHIYIGIYIYICIYIYIYVRGAVPQGDEHVTRGPGRGFGIGRAPKIRNRRNLVLLHAKGRVKRTNALRYSRLLLRERSPAPFPEGDEHVTRVPADLGIWGQFFSLIYIYIYLSISVYRSIYLSIYLSIHISIYLYLIICPSINIHIHIHIHIYIYIYAYMHTRPRLARRRCPRGMSTSPASLDAGARIHAPYIYIHKYACVYIHTYICMHVYIYTHTHIYIYIYIYIYIHIYVL
jgi:hypothetical protein